MSDQNAALFDKLDGFYVTKSEHDWLERRFSNMTEKEKILLALGNIAGVASVDDQITVSGPVVAAARFVVVKKGDTLWAISAKYYGAGAQYTKIYGANTDKISNPNLIYPGQVLTIP